VCVPWFCVLVRAPRGRNKKANRQTGNSRQGFCVLIQYSDYGMVSRLRFLDYDYDETAFFQ